MDRRVIDAPQGAAAPPYPAPRAGCAVFLDIDGTLVDYAERPSAVRVDEPLIELLARARGTCGGALAFISGRSIADVDRLFHPLELPVAGQHGVERRDHAGRLHLHVLPEAGLRNAAARLAQLAAQHPGVIIEDKGLNLAVHFRLAPELGEMVERLMRGLAEELGGQFQVQGGKMLWEIRPSGRDKGTAVAEFMSEPPFRGRVPVFIGDDLTDEYGFRLVNELGGLSIKVGSGETAAAGRLPDVHAVRAWLGELVRVAGAAQAGGAQG